MACCILLDTSSVFCKNIISGLWQSFLRISDFSKFSGLFSTCFEISVSNLVYVCSRWCYTSSLSFIQFGTLWPTLQPEISQSHLSAFMAFKIIYRGLRFGTHTNVLSVLIPNDFRYGWAIFSPLADKKHLNGGVTRAPSQRKVFPHFLCTCFAISVWNLAYTSSGWCHTSSSSFIPIWTLWPTLQPKIGQIIYLHSWPPNYIEASNLVNTLKYWVSWPLLMLGQFLALWWTKTHERGS